MVFSNLFLFSYVPFSAVLDECTNGVAPDVEVELYRRCQELGITVFSISHKLELKTLHDYELHYLCDGQGGYTFSPIDHEHDTFRVSQSGEFVANLTNDPSEEGAGIASDGEGEGEGK